MQAKYSKADFMQFYVQDRQRNRKTNQQTMQRDHYTRKRT